jgi:TolA-binding protein
MKNARALSLITTVLALSACQLQTREDVQKQDEQKQMREQISVIQKNKADTELKYSDIQNDMRVIVGRIDSIEHNQQTQQQNQKQEIENIKKLIETQNEKMKLLQAHMEATETRLTAAIQALSGGPGPVAPSHAGGGSASAGGSGVAAGAGGEAKASGPFEEAEAFFGAKEYKKAIVKYQNYIDKNAKGKNVAESTYKIGVCFAELGLKKDAKEFYKEVVDNYPSSSWAKKAKYRLTHLK